MRGQGLPLNTIIIAIIVIVVLVVVILIFTGNSQRFVESTTDKCAIAGGICTESCTPANTLFAGGCDSGVCCRSDADRTSARDGGTIAAGAVIPISANVPADARGVSARVTSPNGVDEVALSTSPSITGAVTTPLERYRGTYTRTDMPGTYVVEVSYVDASGERILSSTTRYEVRSDATRLAFITAHPEQGAAEERVRLSAQFGGEQPNNVVAWFTNEFGAHTRVELRPVSSVRVTEPAAEPIGGIDPGESTSPNYVGSWEPDYLGTYTVSIEAQTSTGERIWEDRASFTRGIGLEPILLTARDLLIEEDGRAEALVWVQFPGFDADVSVIVDGQETSLRETAVHGGIIREFTGLLSDLTIGEYSADIQVSHVGGTRTFEEAFTITVEESAPEIEPFLTVEPNGALIGETITFTGTADPSSGRVTVRINGPAERTIELEQGDPTVWRGRTSIDTAGEYSASLEIDGRAAQATAGFRVLEPEPSLVSFTAEPRELVGSGTVQLSAEITNPDEPVVVSIEGVAERVALERLSTLTDIYRGSIELSDKGVHRLLLRSGDTTLGGGLTVVVSEPERRTPVATRDPLIRYDGGIVGGAPLPTGGETSVTYWIRYSGSISGSVILIDERRTEQSIEASVTRTGDEHTLEARFIANTPGTFRLAFDVETGDDTYRFSTDTTITFTRGSQVCLSTEQCSSGSCVYDGSEYTCSAACGQAGDAVADANSCCAGLTFDGRMCRAAIENENRLRLVFAPGDLGPSDMGAYRQLARETVEELRKQIYPSCSDPIEAIILETNDCDGICPNHGNDCIYRAEACVGRHVKNYDYAYVITGDSWPGVCGFSFAPGSEGLGALHCGVDTAVHEIGHGFGLGHLSCSRSIEPAGACMYSSNSGDCKLNELTLSQSKEYTSSMIMSYCEKEYFGPVGLTYMQEGDERTARAYNACN